ncbi:MAG: peptidylprolyl isomerase [Planctomycetota bacterium]
MNVTRLPALLLILPLLGADAGAPADKKDAKPVAVSLAAKKAEVVLGEPIELAVTIENRGDAPVSVPKPILSSRSVTFLVTFGKSTFEWKRFIKDVYQVEDPARVPLKPGEKTEAVFAAPSVAAGDYKIRARVDAPSGALESAEITVKVKPRVEGEKEKRREARELEAVVETTHGAFRVRLWPERALGTVWNFAELAGKGFFDNTKIHRIISDFMFQGGDPDGTGMGGPGYSIPAEFNDARHEPGVLSMARTDHPDSAGSQFFVCLGSPSFLDGKYTAFGRVSEGTETLDRFVKIPVVAGDSGESSVPKEDVRFKRIRLEPKFEPAPEK